MTIWKRRTRCGEGNGWFIWRGASTATRRRNKGSRLPGSTGEAGLGSPGPWGFVAIANITPDPSGIPFYDEALFLEVMHTGSVKARKLSSIMPVMVYRN